MKLSKLYVVLDLDNTLIHTKIGQNNSVSIRRRDGVYMLLNFLSKHCKGIIIWTSGTSNWVKLIVNKFFKKFKFELKLNRTSCDVLEKSSIPNKYWSTCSLSKNDVNEEILLKDINVIKNKIEDATDKNILFLDDYDLVAYKNRKNLYQIKRYMGDCDSEIFRFICWLIQIKYYKENDIRKIPKKLDF